MNFMEDTLAVYLNQALILLDGDEEADTIPQWFLVRSCNNIMNAHKR